MNTLPTRIRRLISEVEEIKWMIEKGLLESVQILQYQEFKSIVLLFSGAIDSAYEGFWFRIRILWPQDYPFRPPKCLLLDKIWNPYVDFTTNELCIDILKDQFSPALKLIQYILSIISLLAQTKIYEGSFLNPDAAFQMSKNYPYFFQHARKHCETYSYKKKEIYSNNMRGLPEEHQILVQSSLIPGMIAASQNSNAFNKKIGIQKLVMEEEEKQKGLEKMSSEEFQKEVESQKQKIKENLKLYGSCLPPT